MIKWITTSIRVLRKDQIKIHKKYSILEVPDIHYNPLYILAIKSNKTGCEDCILWTKSSISRDENYKIDSISVGYCAFETSFSRCLSDIASAKLRASRLVMTFNSMNSLSLLQISYLRLNIKL